MASNKNLTNNTTVKVEPGPSTQRLPSLKPPRDLSLSAFKLNIPGSLNQPPKKKIYIPNFNVQRNRPQENASSPAVKQEPPADSNAKQNHDSSGGRGRGRGRGRGSKTFIQTNSGIFSSGVECNTKSRPFRERQSADRGGGGDLQKPKLNKENSSVNKDVEDEAMKDLLRDNFIDDPSLDPDYDNCPIKLPLSKSSLFFLKDEASIKDEKGVKIKVEPMEIIDHNSKVASQNSVTLNGETKQIKEETPDVDDDDGINGLETKMSGTGLDYDDEKFKNTSVGSIADLISSSREDRFFQLQLPSCLPGINLQTDNTRSQAHKQEDPTSASESSSTEETRSQGQTLRDIPSGQVGKIQIMKSGRTRLILGNTKMWLEPGTQVAFNQELMGLDLDKSTHTGNANCLGSVALRMMVCPDWDWLVSQTSQQS